MPASRIDNKSSRYFTFLNNNGYTLPITLRQDHVMIRHIKCIRKNPDLSDEEFRAFWNAPEYEDLNQQLVTLTKSTRHTRNLALKVEATQRIIADREFIDPFDAVIEFWWEAASQLMELYDTPEAQQLRKKISENESQFIDKSPIRSSARFKTALYPMEVSFPPCGSWPIISR